MRRLSLTFVALVMVFAVVFGALEGIRPAGADERAVTVEAGFSPPDNAEDGDACGMRGQVIVRDAAGVIVGKVDLADRTASVRGDAPKPGTVEDRLCWVKADIELPDSPYYTFTVRDHYEWTWSATELDESGNVVRFAWLLF